MSEAPAYLIDLMHDKNTEIRKVCDQTLDIIMVMFDTPGEKSQDTAPLLTYKGVLANHDGDGDESVNKQKV